MGKPIEWFANKAKNIIGAIALTKIRKSWNFAVLQRNILGKFQVREIGQNFFNLGQIRVQLRAAMSPLRKRWFHENTD